MPDQAPENASAPMQAHLKAKLGNLESNEERSFRNLRELPRRFVLYRDVDETGISGIGIVAHGIQFRRSGKCFMEWVTPNTQATWGLYDSVYALTQVHGHSGKTRILWPDDYCTAGISIEGGPVLNCIRDPGHDTEDHWDNQTGISWTDMARGAIRPVELVGSNYQTALIARDKHMRDVYAALGVKWGEDPFPVIAALRDKRQ